MTLLSIATTLLLLLCSVRQHSKQQIYKHPWLITSLFIMHKLELEDRLSVEITGCDRIIYRFIYHDADVDSWWLLPCVVTLDYVLVGWWLYVDSWWLLSCVVALDYVLVGWWLYVYSWWLLPCVVALDYVLVGWWLYVYSWWLLPCVVALDYVLVGWLFSHVNFTFISRIS